MAPISHGSILRTNQWRFLHTRDLLTHVQTQYTHVWIPSHLVTMQLPWIHGGRRFQTHCLVAIAICCQTTSGDNPLLWLIADYKRIPGPINGSLYTQVTSLCMCKHSIHMNLTPFGDHPVAMDTRRSPVPDTLPGGYCYSLPDNYWW